MISSKITNNPTQEAKIQDSTSIIKTKKMLKVEKNLARKQLREKLSERKIKINKTISETKQKISELTLKNNINEDVLEEISFLRKKMRYLSLTLRDKDPDIIILKEGFDQNNVFEINDFSLWYLNGEKQALFSINLNIKRHSVTSFIGPSGCGKSSLLTSLNKINELTSGVVQKGSIFFNGKNVNSKILPSIELRTKVGMIFQKPTPFPISIYENVAFALRNHGIKDKKVLDVLVKEALEQSALWDEVKDNLENLGTSLSGGQQQRLCIARAIALKPEVLLMDEPTSALDPIATKKIEELISTLRTQYTIIIVTHSMAQAQRVSDDTVFFYRGVVVEYNTTKNIFTNPMQQRTKDYILGKMG